MAQRTVALCDGKYIGIETIYTVINGRQINIPEKLKELSLMHIPIKTLYALSSSILSATNAINSPLVGFS